jgi:hypothetical protein
LQRIEQAVPGADITVIRLRAPLDLMLKRIEAREKGDPTWYLQAAKELSESMEDSGVEDHVVENADRTPAETAAEALRAAGWLFI